MEIKNKNNEILDTSLDGVQLNEAEEVIIYNHGFGTDKHERGIANQIAETLLPSLNDKSFLRFSYSGYGQSEGNQELKTVDTMAEDLVSVWDYVLKNKKERAKIITISFSLGNQVIVNALSKMEIPIERMIFVNPAAFKSGMEMREKWASRPGVEHEAGVMIIPRADGSISRIGECFWESINPIKYKEGLTKFSKKYNSVLIRATEDDIVENEDLLLIPFKRIIELKGDHNFSKPEDRNEFLAKINETLTGKIK